MKCVECGKRMAKKLGTHHYVESGLGNVYLEQIPINVCSCGYSEVEIPEIMSLHEMICKHLVSTAATLRGDEIRFIRTTLGYTAEKFSMLLGVHKGSVSRWENGKSPMNRGNAYMLKLIVLDHFTNERKKVVEMIRDISISEEEAARRVEEQLRSGRSDRKFLRFRIPSSRGKKAQLALELV